MLHICSRAAAALLIAAVWSNCALGPGKKAHEPPNYFWNGDGVEGSPRIVISLSDQKAYYYKGNKMVGMSPISSGREPGWTKAGKFQISEKDIDHRSSAYGSFVRNDDGTVIDGDVDARTDTTPPNAHFEGANMHYFMRVTGAIGMHQGYLPGFPASHGCIRLPANMAAIYYRETPLGTPVEVREAPVTIPPGIVPQEPQTTPAPALAKVEPKPAAKPAPLPKATTAAPHIAFAKKETKPAAPKARENVHLNTDWPPSSPLRTRGVVTPANRGTGGGAKSRPGQTLYLDANW
jgi:hypothetical protein